MVFNVLWDKVNEDNLYNLLFEVFNINNESFKLNELFKFYVLLFDEYYIEFYWIFEV